MGKTVVVAFLCLIEVTLKINGDCQLSLQKDFATASPVVLQDGVFLKPDSSGRVTVPANTALTVACPGERRALVLANSTTEMQEAEVTCIENQTFRVSTRLWQGPFKDIRCNGQPWFSAEDEDTCYNGNRLYKIGYKIQNVFHKVYEACFDHGTLSTLYVKHRLSPVSKFTQSGSRRPQFIEGGLFGKVRMSELYKMKNQKTRFDEVLGAGMGDKYISKKQFLTRGHLAPRGDFVLSAVQRASFHYVNTAPQWMRTNAGDWAALEDALRRRVHKLNSSLTVYTGTFGVLRAGKTDLYLASDENGNDIVPVPMYFYKVVHNPLRRKAVAFVTINSSFYNHTETDSLTFCCDVCEEGSQGSHFAWLRWRNDGSHSFCCSYDEFARKVKHLPRLDVDGLFY